MCPGKIERVRERQKVSGKDRICPGKTECVHERQTVSGKERMCPGKIECVRERKNVSGKDRMYGSSYYMFKFYVEFTQIGKYMRKRLTDIHFRPYVK
jgi:hypothetical protein